MRKRHASQYANFGSLLKGIIQHFHKEQKCHLFKDCYEISDTSCPKSIPYIIYLSVNFSGYYKSCFLFLLLFSAVI